MMPSANKQEGEAAGDRPQRLCGLRGGLDRRDAMRVERRGGREDDEHRDDVAEDHADQRVLADARHLRPRLLRRRRKAAWNGCRFSSSISCAACQKNRYGLIVVPRMATKPVANAAVHSMCGTNDAAKRLAPGHVHAEHDRDIGEQAERREFQDGGILAVVEEDLEQHAKHAEAERVGDHVRRPAASA